MTILEVGLGALSGVSLGIGGWQHAAASRFPLHRRLTEMPRDLPPVTLLKPLKGADAGTESCLRSWLEQAYPGPVQVLFGVKDPSDEAAGVVTRLMQDYPSANARMVICPDAIGANPKVSKLIQMESFVTGEVVVISDADVEVPAHYLAEAVSLLQAPDVGLVNSFYRLGDGENLAMGVQAVAVNSDFWSQVCQSNSMRPMRFALGTAMTLRLATLKAMGGFDSLAGYLADDNRLGVLVANAGLKIVLTPTVVDCRSSRKSWKEVWVHQLRWERTIRVCEPWLYFLSLMANATLWPMALLAISAMSLERHGFMPALGFVAACLGWRCWTANQHYRWLTGRPLPWRRRAFPLLRDLVQAAWWLGAFLGNIVVWRGERYRLLKNGKLELLDRSGREPRASPSLDPVVRR